MEVKGLKWKKKILRGLKWIWIKLEGVLFNFAKKFPHRAYNVCIKQKKKKRKEKKKEEHKWKVEKSSFNIIGMFYTHLHEYIYLGYWHCYCYNIIIPIQAYPF